MNIPVPGTYASRQYGHLFLGNGIDFLQVDWTGSMSFKEQINGNFGYWMKLDRKSGDSADPLPLVRVKYCLVSGAGPIEISESKQRFDPETATLVSQVEAEPFRFSLTTFLTDDHVLVMNFKFRQAPADGQVYFALDDNRNTYTGKLVSRLSEPVTYSTKGDLIVAQYANDGPFPFKGIGVMGVVAEGNTARLTISRDSAIPVFGSSSDRSSKQPLRAVFPYLTSRVLIAAHDLHAGSELTCYTCVMDDLDELHYRKRAFATIAKAEADGFKRVHSGHQTQWRRYMSRSRVAINDDVDYQHRLSLYALKAAQHPTGALVTSPMFPSGHGCLVYWDAYFCQMGLLMNGRLDEAKRIALFWKRGLEAARKNARSAGGKGAYYGWTLNLEGCDTRAALVNQVHLNGDIALSCFQYFEHTGDIAFLKEAFPVMKDTIDFLISAYVGDNRNGLFLKPCESLDESAYDRTNDTWTIALILQGIDGIQRAAALLDERVDRAAYDTVRDGLISALKRNCANGILYANGSKEDMNIGSVLAMLTLADALPEGVNRTKTFRRYVAGAMEGSGLGWGHASRMRCEIFPWAELISAVFLAGTGSPLAAKHLARGMEATNSYGGFMEYVWEHGIGSSREWYLATHGSYLWALGQMLATASGNVIELLPAVPPDWTNIDCRDLRLPGGVALTMTAIRGRLKRVVVRNTTTLDISRVVRHHDRKTQIAVAAGKSVVIENL